MRRTLTWLLAAGATLALLAFVLVRVPAVQDFLVRRAIHRVMASSQNDLLGDDALRVLLCGSSSPIPSRNRAEACVAVFAGGRFYVVDVGLGSSRNFALWGVPEKQIGGVLLTHFHSDHIGELGEWNLQTWIAGRGKPLQVYGPPGVEKVVAGFDQAYALDSGYRVAHHGADFLPPAAARMEAVTIPVDGLKQPGSFAPVWSGNGLTIRAFLVDHRPVKPCVGYRFDYGGRSVVVSGDTVKIPGMVVAAHGVDVLVHEALSRQLVAMLRQGALETGHNRVAKILGDIPSYHTTPVQAAQVANEAGARLLVLTHLAPAPRNAFMERIFMRGVSKVRPRGVLLGRDGLLVTLPTGSRAIRIGQLHDRG